MANIGFKEDLVNEFKSDKSCLYDSDMIDAVVAFANSDGGDLYLGVEDDGEVTDLNKNHTDITMLSAFIANNSSTLICTSGISGSGKAIHQNIRS